MPTTDTSGTHGTPPPSQRRNHRRRRRPPPPPPPPASLVQLLQTDSSVVTYFQSLQTNLDADVQIWKDRAHQLQLEHDRLLQRCGRHHQHDDDDKEDPAKPRGSKKRSTLQPTCHPVVTSQKVVATPKTTRRRQTSKLSYIGATAKRRVESSSPNSFGLERPLDDDETGPSKTPIETNGDEKQDATLERATNVGVPIDDSMFDSLDDDDDDDDDDASVRLGDAISPTPAATAVTRPSEQDEWDQDATQYQQQVFAFLCEAYQIMTRLGIFLVEQETTTHLDSSQNDLAHDHSNVSIIPNRPMNVLPPNDNTDETGVTDAMTLDRGMHRECESIALPIDDEQGTDTRAVDTLRIENEQVIDENVALCTAQSDEQVVTIILDWLRSPTLPHDCFLQATSDGETSEHPKTVNDGLICDTSLILCCNPLLDADSSTQHPLLQAKRLLIRALALMDTFCSPTLTKTEWDVYFESAAVDTHIRHAMKVGLRGRKRVVDRLLHSLDTEITERWACHDRAKRQNVPAVFFTSGGGSSVSSSSLSSSLLGGAATRPFLKTLTERSMACQVVSALHLLRHEDDKAVESVLQYFFSTTPCLSLEDHPKLPPAMSMLVIESLLLQSDESLLDYQKSESDCGYKGDAEWFNARCLSMWNGCVDRDIFCRAMALPVHVSASIWSERLLSPDPIIHDVACIELASYRRILKINSWLSNDVSTADGVDSIFLRLGSVDWLEAACSVANQILEAASLKGISKDSARQIDAWHVFLQIPLVLCRGVTAIEEVSLEAMSDHAKSTVSRCEVGRGLLLWKYFVSSSLVRRAIVLRSMDARGKNIDEGAVNSYFSQFFDAIVMGSLSWSSSERLPLICAGLQCATIASDGNCALRAVQLLVELEKENEHTSNKREANVRSFLDLMKWSSQIPVVRVINLKRRKDRLDDFTRRAMRERIVVVKAVTSIREVVRTDDVCLQVGDGYEFGMYAFDGQGRLVEANDQLAKQVGPTLNKLVETHWRPNDLKAFDRNAPDAETAVRTSPSERACALSHLASWIGVKRTLHMTIQTHALSYTERNHLFRSSDHAMRMFKISGFAKGPALLAKNDTMPPSPVCVILEDDAIIVDRFVERLSDILEELPRDFHFCSLGYSRPKSAPIAPYGKHLGIPSMMWYLTGYCLSEAGANYLLESLPVVGPVDSWIGLKMTRNWDNAFGVKLGVGVHSKPKSELPSHSDLARILEFRAFCARIPLCTQRVGDTGVAGSVVAAATWRSRCNWRQRDTDIEYSGNAVNLTRDANR